MPAADEVPFYHLDHELNKILLVDAYDSFSNNIINLLETELPNVVVSTIKIDADVTESEILELVSHFEAVVVGPGPGDPTKSSDIGFVRHLWSLRDSHVLPTLGVCLGMQSLASAFGANIRRLKEPQHGLVLKDVPHIRTSIFSTSSSLNVTKYHSLHAVIDKESRSRSSPEDSWKSSDSCPELRPLAWDYSTINGNVLMAVEHISKPFCGVQYHPESICTNREGTKVVKDWWRQARKWNTLRRRFISRENMSEKIEKLISPPVTSRRSLLEQARQHHKRLLRSDLLQIKSSKVECTSVSFSKPVEIAQLYEMLGLETGDAILLESNSPNNQTNESRSIQDQKSRYSILAVPISGKTPFFQYYLHDEYISLKTIEIDCSGAHSYTNDTKLALALGDSDNPAKCTQSVWQFLAHFMESQECEGGLSHLPFWGGLIGSLSYEFGVAGLGVDPRPNQIPDINLAFIQRSIIYDHLENRAWIQSTLHGDEEWVQTIKARLSITDQREPLQPITRLNGEAIRPGNKTYDSRVLVRESTKPAHEESSESKIQSMTLDLPERGSYIADIDECHENIRAGESYELCLTSQSHITTRRPLAAKTSPDWALYKSLRGLNPAPFAAYMSFGNVSIIGCSPERFLKWTRDGKCEMRPIKGTLSKNEVRTMQEAERLLGSEKERAENLMIVDLIRHDLYGICGSGNVEVKRLMYVEEHPTVFQLVSNIEGILPGSQSSVEGRYSNSSIGSSNIHLNQINKTEIKTRSTLTGIDVLAACFPPGSMTGAPKKRSCEILQSIENQPRGIYSGVLGYICVGGSGDFSVVIRSAVRDHNLTTKEDCLVRTYHGSRVEKCRVDRWSIGAGGAITALSDPEAEFDEMKTKSSVTLRMFEKMSSS
jgi:para-aminobenzoate synthetase